MNEQDKQAFDEFVRKEGECFDPGAEFWAELAFKFALEYSRGQQEPVGEVGTMPGTTGFTMACFKSSDVPIGSKLYIHPAPKSYAEQCQAEGWLAVRKTLDELMPGWTEKSDSGMEAACTAIRELAQPVQPAELKLTDIEQYNLQMAAIGTAAFGYWKEGDSIHPDYDTVPLRDVAKLHAKYEVAAAINEQLLEALKKAEAALSDIGDAEREEFDDLAWCEGRAWQELSIVRKAIAAAEAAKGVCDA